MVLHESTLDIAGRDISLFFGHLGLLGNFKTILAETLRIFAKYRMIIVISYYFVSLKTNNTWVMVSINAVFPLTSVPI